MKIGTTNNATTVKGIKYVAQDFGNNYCSKGTLVDTEAECKHVAYEFKQSSYVNYGASRPKGCNAGSDAKGWSLSFNKHSPGKSVWNSSPVCKVKVTVTLFTSAADTATAWAPQSTRELNTAVYYYRIGESHRWCSVRCKSFSHGPIGSWDVSAVTNMDQIFNVVVPGADEFNADLSKWDVSRVTRMHSMFSGSLFNGDISKWDVSRVFNMYKMFYYASLFDGDISKWDVSRVILMNEMFCHASLFNGDISKWDVSRVQYMHAMFHSASAFNGDLSKWDVSSVTAMDETFYHASSFKSDLSKWDVSQVAQAFRMFTGSSVSKLCSKTWTRFNKRYGKRSGGTSLIDIKSGACTGKCPKRQYYEGTDFVGDCLDCPKGRFGKSSELVGLDACTDCPQGQYGNTSGRTKCDKCPAGQFTDNTGMQSCSKCETGKYQKDSGQPLCVDCTKGQYGNTSGLSKCEHCPPGQVTAKAGMRNCIMCETGKFQKDSGQADCVDCQKGSHGNTSGLSKCNECPAGQVTQKAGRQNCSKCETGRYQMYSGQSKCEKVHKCEVGKFISAKATATSPPKCNPFPLTVAVIIVILVIAALIFPTYKLVQLIIRQARVYKPQSKADAALAEKFKVPKDDPEIQACIKNLKTLERKLLRNGEWTERHVEAVTDHSNQVLCYLSQRVAEASDVQQVRIMVRCLKMDAMHDFKTLYAATMKNIRFKEREGFSKYMVVAQNAEKAVANVTCPVNPSTLVELCRSGRAVYDRFHDFIERAAKASDTGTAYRPHGKRATMKGIYRVLEKACFKYDSIWENPDELDVSHVLDFVRGGIIDTTMAGIADVTNYILNSEEVTVCRVKDRFTKPSDSGWADLMLNFYLNDDDGQHVCEVQLIHFKMLSQRTTQEGHGSYNVFRAASELLNHKNLVRRQSAGRKLTLRAASELLKKKLTRRQSSGRKLTGQQSSTVFGAASKLLNNKKLTKRQSSGQNKNVMKNRRSPKVVPIVSNVVQITEKDNDDARRSPKVVPLVSNVVQITEKDHDNDDTTEISITTKR